MSDIGDKLDEAIAEAEEQKTRSAAERDAAQREAEKRRTETARIAEEVVLPALQELVDEAEKRGHFARASISDQLRVGHTTAVVEFDYWPGEGPEGEDGYSLEYVVSGDGTMNVREEVRRGGGMSRMGNLLAGRGSVEASREQAQEIALELMTRAIRDEIR